MKTDFRETITKWVGATSIAPLLGKEVDVDAVTNQILSAVSELAEGCLGEDEKPHCDKKRCPWCEKVLYGNFVRAEIHQRFKEALG